MVFFGVIAICASVAFGQAEAGSISGTVHDASGSVIPDAMIVARNLATGAGADQIGFYFSGLL